MRIRQVTEGIKADRIKEAPANVLRAVFAGIGQLLIVADRIRKQAADRASATAGGPEPGPAAHPGPGPEPAGPPEADPAQARWRSLDKTGNVRLLSAEDLADGSADPPAGSAGAAGAAETETLSLAETPTPVSTPVSTSAAPLADSAPPAEPAPTPDATGSAGGAALPVPNYDSLSLPSLRARLRALDAAQVRVLAEYERSHAGRADVVAMFERRIAKLEAER